MLLSAAAIVILALVHVLTPRMTFLDVVPRSRWLSLAGGAAVAYVFLQLLPELAGHQATLAAAEGAAALGEQAVYAVALVGLTLFYGLERMVRTLPARRTDAFRVHLATFALYNVLIGYLVLVERRDDSLVGMVLFALAMGLHFLSSDYGMRLDDRARYDRRGRWLLAAALAAGGAIGAVGEVPDWLVAALFAFLAGGVLLNVLKEELPEERQSRFWPFLAGVVLYGALLFFV